MIINNLYNKDEEITIESYLLKNDIKDISEFINPTGKYIDNYSSYNNMDKAVKELKKHYENNEDKIFIIQDPDVDGIVSASILYQYLKALKDWDISILMHTGKQRGISDVDIFKKIKEEKPNLVIVPDAGSNDKEQIDELCDLGISYIALDHHIISTPSDYGILVNNQDENSKVSKKGSGGLVTHKFLEALDNEFNKEWSSWFIDMVALSLLSDSMDMSDQQNRTYYHYGLETMDCVNNIFLKECIKTFINKDTYSQRDLSFKIIPKFNAICRSKDQELKQKLFLSFIGEYDISDMLVLCEEAHKKQQKTVASIIDNNIDTIKKANKNNIVVFYSDDIPSSYSGLVGGKMMSICDNKPCIVGSIEDGYFLGSLRSPISLGEELDNNEFVEWARGHEKACGIKIKEENIDKLVEYYNNVTLDYTPHIDVLNSYSIKSIPNDLFGLFEPYNSLFGKGLPKPKYYVKDIIINPKMDIFILGANRRTLKIRYNNIDIMIFNSTNQERLDLGLVNEENKFVYDPKDIKLNLSVIGEFVVNKWTSKYGKVNKNNQIIVDKFEVSKIKTVKDTRKLKNINRTT